MIEFLKSTYRIINLLFLLKFIYSEKATKFCEIFPLLLTVCTVVKSKGKISQNFVAFSEYMNFTVSWVVNIHMVSSKLVRFENQYKDDHTIVT